MPKLTSWQPSQKSWFLGIGIDQYKSFDPLANAVKGIAEVKSLLLHNYDIDPDCAITLFDKKATKEKIVDTLDDLGGKIQPGDKLIIYYSGHGHLNEDLGIGYWIPVDAKKEKASSYLPNSTIRDYIKAIKAKHILLVSDSCFSGSLFMQGAFRTSRAVKELDNLTSRWAICSGRHDEKVYDGHPGENSPFTQSFIDFLTHSALDNINVARLADHIIEQTAANYQQLPDGRPMFGVGHQGGQYIFWKKNTVKEGSSPQVKTLSSTQVPSSKEQSAQLTEIPFYKKKSAIAALFGMLTIVIAGFLILNKKDTPSSGSESVNVLTEETTPPEKVSKTKTSISSTAKAQPPAVALVSNIDDAVIELYELEQYKGRMLPLYGGNSSTVNNFNKMQVEGMQFEDVISSLTLTIPKDYEFVLYEKRKQKGESITLVGNGQKQYFPSIGALIGKVSSCELREKSN